MSRLSNPVVGFICAVSVLGLAACRVQSPPDSGTPSVVVAFYPLQFLVERIAGDAVELKTLTPPGVEPHDVELTPSQVEAATDADLLIYLGQGFQPALEDVLDSVKGEKVDILDDELLGRSEEGKQNAEESPTDPHVWLDPNRMIEIARSVTAHLEEVDKGEESESPYAAASVELIRELEALDSEFQEGLAHCRRRQLVTAHEAFGYLAERYKLEQVGISGIDPESEPTGARLAEVARLVRQEGVTTIFFESLLPPNVAETIARETGTATAVLDPLESPPEDGDYLSAMRANLSAIRKALECS